MKPLSFPPCLRAFIYQRANQANAQQRRHIHLWMSYKTAMDGDVANFFPFRDYLPASQVIVSLKLDDESSVQQLCLQHILENLLKPGHALVPLHKIESDDAPGVLYTIKNISVVRRLDVGTKPFSGHLQLKPKLFKFSSAAKTPFVIEALQTAMQSIKDGSRVEIQVSRPGPANAYHFRHMLKNRVHLRPDVILKAMPRKSGIVIHPQTDNKSVCWVMAPPFVRDGKDLEVPLDQSYLFLKKRGEFLGKLARDQKPGKEAKPAVLARKIIDGAIATEEIDTGTEPKGVDVGAEPKAAATEDLDAKKGVDASVDEVHDEEIPIEELSDAKKSAEATPAEPAVTETQDDAAAPDKQAVHPS